MLKCIMHLPFGWNFPLWSADPTIWTWQSPVCMHTCKDSLSSSVPVRERRRKQTWGRADSEHHEVKHLVLLCFLSERQLPSSQGSEVLCLSCQSEKEQDLPPAYSPKIGQRARNIKTLKDTDVSHTCFGSNRVRMWSLMDSLFVPVVGWWHQQNVVRTTFTWIKKRQNLLQRGGLTFRVNSNS